MSEAPFTQPRQARSRATLERLAQTARKSLEVRDWDQLKVNQLCTEARSSVGAFYARFQNKEGLLEYLTREADEEYRAVIAWFCADVDQRALPLASRLRQLVAALWRFTDRHAGVLRALIELRRPLPFDQEAQAQRLASALPADSRGDVATRVLLDVLRARLIKNTPPGQPDRAIALVLETYLRF